MRLGFVVLLLASACTSTPPPACKTVETDCGLLYEPTFHNVYTNTLSMSCGSDKSSCHSATGHKGGLSFADEQTAYDGLLDMTQGRVKPGDPECSEMIVRTSSPGEDYVMPPGDSLIASERCSLIKWVLGGALR